MDVIELVVNEYNLESGVDAISLVEYPAIEESKACEPDQHQKNSPDETSEEYTREDVEFFSGS